MKVGVSAMWLSAEQGASNSGLSRYASGLLGAMLPLAPEDAFFVHAPSTFPFPASWSALPNFTGTSVNVPSLPARVFWEHVIAGRVARRLGVDLWFSAAQAIPLSRRVKRAVMVHDMIPLLYPEIHLRRTVLYYRFALRHSCRHADLVLANSEATKQDLVHHLGADAGKVVVTPLGPGNTVERMARVAVDPAALRALGVRRPRFVLTLANLDHRKNLARLVEAFADVRGRPGCGDLGLVVVGARRAQQHEPLLRRIAELELADAVDLLGYVPDEALPALFASAEVFAFPSIYEGFGLPVLEAMTLGAPVVCSNSSSLPEVGGEAARYFNPLDVADMAGALHAVLADPDLRQEMRTVGLERARSFTWNRTARQTLDAFSSTL